MVAPPKLAILPNAKIYLEQSWKQAGPPAWDVVSCLEEAKTKGYQWAFTFETGLLMLRSLENKNLDKIKVDFSSGNMAYRQHHGQGRGELLAKAVGVKKHHALSVLDVTAGLGKDGFILASLGCEVTMLERSPIVAALLQNGLDRATKEIDLLPIVERMHFFKMDAIEFLQKTNNNSADRTLAPGFDCIYLDPMFPENKKSRLVKKDMRAFRLLVGEDFDSSDLFEMAMAFGAHRLVVKRHRHDPPLGAIKPEVCFTGKTSRFDVYIHHPRSECTQT